MLTLYSLSSPAKSLSRIWRVDVCIEEFVGKRRPQSLTLILVGPLVFLFWVIYFYGKRQTENKGVRLFASTCDFQLNNNVEWDEVLWDELAYLQYTVVVSRVRFLLAAVFPRGRQENKYCAEQWYCCMTSFGQKRQDNRYLPRQFPGFYG